MGAAKPNQVASAESGTQFAATHGSLLRTPNSLVAKKSGRPTGGQKPVPDQGDHGVIRLSMNSSAVELCNGGLRLERTGLNSNAVAMYTAAMQKLDAESRSTETWVVQNETLNLEQFEAFLYKCRAVSFLEEGERTSAIEDLNEAIRRCPDDASCYLTRGKAYQLNNMVDQAEADFAKARALGGGD
jgi:tetratricopeptide (TPR) repeat protein